MKFGIGYLYYNQCLAFKFNQVPELQISIVHNLVIRRIIKYTKLFISIILSLLARLLMAITLLVTAVVY